MSLQKSYPKEKTKKDLFSYWYDTPISNLDFEVRGWVFFKLGGCVCLESPSQFVFRHCALDCSCVQQSVVLILPELERDVEHFVSFVEL